MRRCERASPLIGLGPGDGYPRRCLTSPAIIALLREHLHSMTLHSPPESIHALDVEALRKPEITFWSAWRNAELVGCGAIKALTPRHGEIKSMRTVSSHLRTGVATGLMHHLIDEARRRSYERSASRRARWRPFAPARSLYARFGFRLCAPFAHYVEDPYSAFMTRDLLAEADHAADNGRLDPQAASRSPRASARHDSALR